MVALRAGPVQAAHTQNRVAMKTAVPVVFDPASLPSPPAIVMRMVRLMADPSTHLHDVLDLLRTDAALSAQTLAACNCVVNHRGHTVNSLEAAVVRLGYTELNRIVCATAFRYVFDAKTPLYTESADILWHRSVYAAVAMEELTDDPAEKDEGYLAGLLHLAGVFLVSKLYPHEGAPLIEANALVRGGEDELALLGQRSGEIGAQALAAWGLPRRVCEAVRWHHEPASAGEAAGMAQRLHTAALLAVTATARRGCPHAVMMTRCFTDPKDPLHTVATRAGVRARVLAR